VENLLGRLTPLPHANLAEHLLSGMLSAAAAAIVEPV